MRNKHHSHALCCADCVYFEACAMWNEGNAASLEICDHLRPYCENCSHSQATCNSSICECKLKGERVPINYFCEFGRAAI